MMTMPVMVSISTYHNNYILLKPIDINECSTGDHLCEQVCVNSIGSYDCECFTGFQLDTNLLNCSGNPIPAEIVVIIIIFTDINECDSDNGGCNHTCHNEIGSFHCECYDGYLLAEDGFLCIGKHFAFLNQKLWLNKTYSMVIKGCLSNASCHMIALVVIFLIIHRYK